MLLSGWPNAPAGVAECSRRAGRVRLLPWTSAPAPRHPRRPCVTAECARRGAECARRGAECTRRHGRVMLRSVRSVRGVRGIRGVSRMHLLRRPSVPAEGAECSRRAGRVRTPTRPSDAARCPSAPVKCCAWAVRCSGGLEDLLYVNIDSNFYYLSFGVTFW